MFFLISGFLLYRPMVAAAFAGRHPRDVRSYARHRFLRIYPGVLGRVHLHHAVLRHLRCRSRAAAASSSTSSSSTCTTPGSAVVNGQHALARARRDLAVVDARGRGELLHLPAVLRRAAAQARDRARPRVAVPARARRCSACSTRSASCGARTCTGACRSGSAVAFLGNFWLPANLDLFALGMGLAVVRVWAGGARGAASACSRRIGRLDWLWWLLAALCFQAVSFWIGLPQKPRARVGRQGVRERVPLQPRPRSSCSCPRCSARRTRGVTRRFLQLRPMVYLGTISYGIYLWHQAFIEKVHQWGGWSDSRCPTVRSSSTLIPALALTIVVASLSWYLVERRCCAARTVRCSARRKPARRAPSPRREHAAAGRRSDHGRLAGFDGLRALAALAIVGAARHVGNRRGHRDRSGPLLRPARRRRHDLLRDLGIPALPAVRRPRTSAARPASRSVRSGGGARCASSRRTGSRSRPRSCCSRPRRCTASGTTPVTTCSCRSTNRNTGSPASCRRGRSRSSCRSTPRCRCTRGCSRRSRGAQSGRRAGRRPSSAAAACCTRSDSAWHIGVVTTREHRRGECALAALR